MDSCKREGFAGGLRKIQLDYPTTTMNERHIQPPSFSKVIPDYIFSTLKGKRSDYVSHAISGTCEQCEALGKGVEEGSREWPVKMLGMQGCPP